MKASWRSLATSRFVSNVDSCYGEIFYLSIFSVTPQKPVQVELSFFQLDRVVHLADVIKGSKDATSESQQDRSDWIQDVRTFDQYVVQAQASVLLAAVPY
jgi:hypothetical protein